MKKQNHSMNFTPGKETLHLEHEIQKNYSDLIFLNLEEQNIHNSYEQELLEMKSIETGDMELLKNCWESVHPSSYGKLSDNKIRNIKNHCIILVAFASRAAIRGGVLPEIAYSLCDSYIRKIEECEEATILAQVARRAEQHLTKLVCDLNNEKKNKINDKPSTHVKNCKKYNFSNLQTKLTVRQVADALHLNPNYLSSLFKRHEGVSLSQFIIKEKIKLAQNMLIYSSYSFSEIAHYLGFSSQSHLGVHFKNIVNLTIGEYRGIYQQKI